MDSSIEANISGSSVNGERSSESASRLLLLLPAKARFSSTYAQTLHFVLYLPKATTSAEPATADGPPMANVNRKTIRYSARSVPKTTRRPGRNSHMTSAMCDDGRGYKLSHAVRILSTMHFSLNWQKQLRGGGPKTTLMLASHENGSSLQRRMARLW